MTFNFCLLFQGIVRNGLSYGLKAFFQFLFIVSSCYVLDGFSIPLPSFNFCLLFPGFVVSLVVLVSIIVFSFIVSGFPDSS